MNNGGIPVVLASQLLGATAKEGGAGDGGDGGGGDEADEAEDEIVDDRRYRLIQYCNSKKRKYTCPYCDVIFANGELFRQHLNIEEREFVCSQCQCAFGTDRERQDHEDARDGNRKYVCDEIIHGHPCRYETAISGHFLSHKRRHKTNSEYRWVGRMQKGETEKSSVARVFQKQKRDGMANCFPGRKPRAPGSGQRTRARRLDREEGSGEDENEASDEHDEEDKAEEKGATAPVRAVAAAGSSAAPAGGPRTKDKYLAERERKVMKLSMPEFGDGTGQGVSISASPAAPASPTSPDSPREGDVFCLPNGNKAEYIDSRSSMCYDAKDLTTGLIYRKCLYHYCEEKGDAAWQPRDRDHFHKSGNGFKPTCKICLSLWRNGGGTNFPATGGGRGGGGGGDSKIGVGSLAGGGNTSLTKLRQKRKREEDDPASTMIKKAKTHV